AGREDNGSAAGSLMISPSGSLASLAEAAASVGGEDARQGRASSLSVSSASCAGGVTVDSLSTVILGDGGMVRGMSAVMEMGGFELPSLQAASSSGSGGVGGGSTAVWGGVDGFPAVAGLSQSGSNESLESHDSTLVAVRGGESVEGKGEGGVVFPAMAAVGPTGMPLSMIHSAAGMVPAAPVMHLSVATPPSLSNHSSLGNLVIPTPMHPPHHHALPPMMHPYYFIPTRAPDGTFLHTPFTGFQPHMFGAPTPTTAAPQFLMGLNPDLSQQQQQQQQEDYATTLHHHHQQQQQFFQQQQQQQQAYYFMHPQMFQHQMLMQPHLISAAAAAAVGGQLGDSQDATSVTSGTGGLTTFTNPPNTIPRRGGSSASRTRKQPPTAASQTKRRRTTAPKRVHASANSNAGGGGGGMVSSQGSWDHQQQNRGYHHDDGEGDAELGQSGESGYAGEMEPTDASACGVDVESRESSPSTKVLAEAAGSAATSSSTGAAPTTAASAAAASAHCVPRRYLCSLCSKRFTRPSTLRTHMNSHTGERPFVCSAPGCGWKFTVLSNLKRHLKICPSVIGAGFSVEDIIGQQMAAAASCSGGGGMMLVGMEMEEGEEEQEDDGER
ncbi:hypothetical protein HDU98_005308, partial [Podochytrium sp. JEL0797]